MANNYTFDNTSSRLYNVLVDEDYNDGNLWINLPDNTRLGCFPKNFEVVLTQSHKEIINGTVELSDEITRTSIGFTDILSTLNPSSAINDFYETRVGQRKRIAFGDSVAVRTPIVSIVLLHPESKVVFAVINLRSPIFVSTDKFLYLTLSFSLRYAMYGAKEVKRGDAESYLNALLTCNYRTFFIRISQGTYLENKPKVISQSAWDSFLNSNKDEVLWPEKLGDAAWVIPNLTGVEYSVNTSIQNDPVLSINGRFEKLENKLEIKGLLLPFVNGIGLVCLFSQVGSVKDGPTKDTITILPNQPVSFSFETKYIGVNQ